MTKKLTQEEFVAISKVSQKNPCDYSKAIYNGRLSKVLIRCLVHDTEYTQQAGLHMQGQSGCKQCCYEKRKESQVLRAMSECGEGYKLCKTCNTCQPFSEFIPNKLGSLGFYSKCKSCISLSAKILRNIPENKIKIKEYSRKHAKNNKAYYNEKSAKRRAMRIQATVEVEDKDFEDLFLKEVYDLAQMREKHTKIKWEVDHVVPLNSDKVCGLHVSWNLRVIIQSLNRQKLNHYWPDMW